MYYSIYLEMSVMSVFIVLLINWFTRIKSLISCFFLKNSFSGGLFLVLTDHLSNNYEKMLK